MSFAKSDLARLCAKFWIYAGVISVPLTSTHFFGDFPFVPPFVKSQKMDNFGVLVKSLLGSGGTFGEAPKRSRMIPL